jgi:alcohol dehydrogenase class IV
MQPFMYTAHPARVIFGSGTIETLPAEIERLDLKRLIVLTTPRQRSKAHDLLERIGPRGVIAFTEATMHTPVDVTEQATKVVARNDIDGIVSIGGGSTIGLSKAIALRTDLPQIAIPTTYAGSEMTPILGETREGVKTTVSNPKVLPETVIYDVQLTLDLPVATSVTSGFNAIAHAVEALYARDGNPVINMLAKKGITSLVEALPAIHRSPSDEDARAIALYGAWLCGICLASVGMALHHKLCHVLGGTFSLPHAETHTAVLPHAIRYNGPEMGNALTCLQQVLRSGDPASAIFDLAAQLGATMALRDLGMPLDGISRATDLALKNPYWNPRSLERSAVESLIESVWEGKRP